MNGYIKLFKIYFLSYNSIKTFFCDVFPLFNLKKLEGLSKDDLELVIPLLIIFSVRYTDRLRFQFKFAVRPVNGPRKNAITYARLMALNFINILRYRSHSPINIFMDCDAFNNLESPVNLYIHYYDELVARTETEFAGY